MIDVLSRLAALDSGNSNVQKAATFVEAKTLVPEEVAQLPELQDMSTLRALSGLKPVNECGPMGMMGGMGSPTPASFSINASAANGDEVASMLTQIMNLAGVHKPDAGAHDAGMLTGEPPEDMSIAQHAAHGGGDGGKDLMRSMMDKMNDPQPEDEGAIGGGMGAAGGAMLGNMVAPGIGGALGAAAGGAMGGSMEDEGSPDSGSPVASMADEVRDMADELANTDKEELGLESYDNTPNSPHSAPQYDPNKMAYNPNAGGANKGVTNQPSAMSGMTLEDQLYAEYKKFMAEHTTGGTQYQHQIPGAEDGDLDDFVNGNRPNFEWEYTQDWDGAEDKFVDAVKKAGYNVTDVDRSANPVIVAQVGNGYVAWYDFENAVGYIKPTHGKSVREAKEKTMSKAAKGMMKYGKQGMKALADAGKKGKDLEPVRAKYNKYD